MTRRKINRKRKTVENIFAFADRLYAISPISLACTAEQYEGSFLKFRAGAVNIAGEQSMDEETHPFPFRVGAWKMQKFARFVGRQLQGMYNRVTVAHERLRKQENRGFSV